MKALNFGPQGPGVKDSTDSRTTRVRRPVVNHAGAAWLDAFARVNPNLNRGFRVFSLDPQNPKPKTQNPKPKTLTLNRPMFKNIRWAPNPLRLWDDEYFQRLWCQLLCCPGSGGFGLRAFGLPSFFFLAGARGGGGGGSFFCCYGI